VDPLRDGLSQQAEALTPATVLRRLAGAASTGEAPEVSVHLAGGQVLGGRPLRVDADRGQEVVLLAGPRGDAFTYALLASVVAVEVREPERVQDVLTGGRMPQPVTGEPVTRMALRREFAPSEEFPLELDWAELPTDGPELANLDRLLRGLRDVARDVCADDVGRRAWAGIRAVRVAHRAGAGPSVEQGPDGLLVRADLSAALPRDLAGELGRQINALL
jgi:hypothetical protein